GRAVLAQPSRAAAGTALALERSPGRVARGATGGAGAALLAGAVAADDRDGDGAYSGGGGGPVAARPQSPPQPAHRTGVNHGLGIRVARSTPARDNRRLSACAREPTDSRSGGHHRAAPGSGRRAA